MSDSNEKLDKGVIGWFAGNHVAANLLMILIILAGALSIFTMKVEVFPELEIDAITVSVQYREPVTPEQVNSGVNRTIEESIKGVDGVEETRSFAYQGRAIVLAGLQDGADLQRVKDDIQAEVDANQNLPDNIERPVITQATDRVQVITLAIYGDVDERTLVELADQVKDDLTDKDNISVVEIEGARNYEISIEIPETTMRKHQLTFDQVVQKIRENSVDLPAGSIDAAGGEILIGAEGQLYTGEEFREIPIIERQDGTIIKLGDIAHVKDGFENSDLASRYNGKPAIYLKVFRVGNQGALDLAETVKTYVADKQVNLPAGVEMDYWFDRSKFLQDRVNLLLRNAAIGLTLVFATLCLFLDLRLAFWTTMGIPISFLGAFWILPLMDVSINMLSLFAFIVVLGVVVDDAIVVGENIFQHRMMGKSAYRAAVDATKEVAMPVLFAILTTVVAFLPLIFVKGVMGQIIKAIPLVVISVLLISLIEVLIILPAHLNSKKLGQGRGVIAKAQEVLRNGLHWVIMNPYRMLLNFSIRWRYATMSTAVAVLIITFTWFAAGRVGTVFLPEMDADNVVAKLEMPQGTSVEQTAAIVRDLEIKALQVQREMDEKYADARGDESLVKNISTTIGDAPFSRLTGGGGPDNITAAGGSHIGEVNIELMPSEDRGNIPSGEVTQRWRELVGEVPGVSSLTFANKFFSAGEAINIELSHSDRDTLLAAVDALKARLAEYPGVTDIDDSYVPGKLEIQTENLTPQANAFGITSAEITRQLNQGFSGQEAQRVQRGKHDVRVMVRYPEAERKSMEDLHRARIRLADGTEVPLDTLVDLEMARGASEVQTTNGRRVVVVTADVNKEVGNADQINAAIFANDIPELMREYPGLDYGIEGEQAERAETFSSLGFNFVAALVLIFVLLGVQFKSYFQPLIVMSAIPFGIVGAIWGHMILGLPLSFLSFFGIVALTGVVVNDSLIMIDLINRERKAGHDSLAVVLEHSGTRRFRPIVLTTLTTFFGLMPMIFETSIQAMFLIPMAVSLGFGVMFATVITLLLVPALYAILEDVTIVVKRVLNYLMPSLELDMSTPEERIELEQVKNATM